MVSRTQGEAAHPLAYNPALMQHTCARNWLRRWAPPLLVMWLALLARLDRLEHTRQNFDRAYPHGLGIIIRDAIAAGRWDDLPLTGITASIALPNPIGASLFYAVLSALDADPYIAAALNALVSMVAVAVVIGVARRRLGGWTAFGAGLLAASSPWAVWVSRGAWLQGPLETFAALAFWLLSNGLLDGRRRHLLAGTTLIAAAMQTYLVTFGLLAAALTALGWRWRALDAAGRRAAQIGLGLCAVSALAYGGALALRGVSLQQMLENPHAFNEVTAAGALNLDPLTHVLRVASGRDFENTFVEDDTAHFAERDRLSDARAGLIEVCIGLGALALAVRRAPADRLLLLWATLPTVGALTIGNWLMPEWKVHVFYLLLASPTPYVLAGAPLAGLALWRAPILRAALLGGFIAAALVSIWNLWGEREALARFPLHHDGLQALPLKWHRWVGAEARAACHYLSNDEPETWLVSLIGDASRVRRATFRRSKQGAAWLIGPQGGACVISAEPSDPPARAEVIAQRSLEGQNRTDRTPAQLALFRARALPEENIPPLETNLGWAQIALIAPEQAEAGQVITVQQSWRIASLPQEPHWFWYFAPFIKLLDVEGRTIAQHDRLPAFGFPAGSRRLVLGHPAAAIQKRPLVALGRLAEGAQVLFEAVLRRVLGAEAVKELGPDLVGGLADRRTDDGRDPGSARAKRKVGAIGFIVLHDLWQFLRGRKNGLTLTSKVILLSTLWISIVGTVLFALDEPGLRGLPAGERWMAALFQVMTASTTVESEML